ncbi:hypothetical protein G4L39_12085 [Limisphaera ngatamarikiensis]|uniref:Uncharacterized protein n=1 Tax=Limisphaera ngatamarikiensis TaxID=1324935 RepID=A0A6M1RK41_9BACT|nr:hypothetical protein [Limisphaera ngatamarikiensis]NGO40126.1 hypothetical protein [Limisphaera ngatamarikiensis]
MITGLLASAMQVTAFEAGPLFHDFQLTLREGRRTEALGPFLSWQQDDETVTRALHPLVSVQQWNGLERSSVDVLYPLCTYDRTGPEARWQLLQVLSWSRGQDQSDRTTERFTLFPLLFWQRSEDPARRSFAILPLYGHLENRLFRDEIDVVLFPLWSRTRKREVITENWLYPLFHTRRGPGLEGWQFWPFYGREEKVPTTRTNAWDETESVPGHRKRFVLWPVYLDAHTGLGTEEPVHQRAVLPFYAETVSARQQSRSWGWPLGVTFSTNAVSGYHEVGAPWPFVVWGEGPGRSTHRFWPLYGVSTAPRQTRQFILWPLWQERHSTTESVDRTERRVGLFVYRDVEERLVEGRRLRRALWPLAVYREDEQGRSRLQVVALLEPVLPGNPGVERNYSPLWSVWRMEQDPVTGRAAGSLLWNLWRWDRTPAGRKGSLLFGAVRYESDAAGLRWRVFGLPVGGRSGTGQSGTQSVSAPGKSQPGPGARPGGGAGG